LPCPRRQSPYWQSAWSGRWQKQHLDTTLLREPFITSNAFPCHSKPQFRYRSQTRTTQSHPLKGRKTGRSWVRGAWSPCCST
jgi:hypothetical protein